MFIGGGDEDVSDSEVAGPDALVIGHPGGRQQGVLGGEQDDIIDGRDLGARDAGELNGPDPADVRRVGAPEPVQRNTFRLHDGAERFADPVAAGLPRLGRLVDGRSPGDLDGPEHDAVGLGCLDLDRRGGDQGRVGDDWSRAFHVTIFAHPRTSPAPFTVNGNPSATRRRADERPMQMSPTP